MLGDRITNSVEIHPSSVIGDDVIIGENVRIGPFCHIFGDVIIGENTMISSFNYIEGPTRIGKDNFIGPNCVIGTPGEHRTAKSVGEVIIGDNNIIRELTVIQRGCGERNTEIRNNCFFMDHVHIAHDVFIEDNVTIAPNVVLAGNITIQDGATIGIGCSVHQFSTIGAYSMIGMNSVVTKDIPPFALVFGSPAVYLRWNTYQLEKQGLGDTPSGQEYEKYVDDFVQYSRRKVISID